MEKTILQHIKKQLIEAAKAKRHPFKFFSLSTMNGDFPSQRMVVLRKVDQDLNLCFYADLRSAKIKQIKSNNTVSALFYDPEQQLQLQIIGKAKIVENKAVLQQVWKSIPKHNQRDYTAATAPGTPIANTNELTYLDTHKHFCMIHIHPFQIDYLQLGHPHHRRLLFANKAGQWQATPLVP